MKRELRIQAPDSTTRVFDLESDSVSLGRAHTNELCYADDASLSRQHLTLERDDEGWTVRDLGSKNGTLVNGVRITAPTRLRPGDRFSAGRLTILFADPDVKGDSQNVEFYVGGPEASTPASGTVMTSLEGLLSGEISRPSFPVQSTSKQRIDSDGTFQSPIVAALIRAGRELTGHRPLDELFRLILDLTINAVGAERGVLMTLEGEELVTRSTHGEGFRISTAVRDRVIQEKTSLLVRDALQDQAFRERLSISEQQIRTMMAAPLQTDQRVIGLIYVDSRFFVRDFTSDDLNLLTVLANVAAIKIEHERLAEVERAERQMKVELNQAASIQQRILPAGAPEVGGLDIAGYNAACRTVGGDYYDFFSYPDERVGLVLGDVAGKGMPAAMLMANLQARVQVLAEDPKDLAALMSRLDRSISANCPRNRFITLFFALVARGGDMVYCNAGHNPPVLIRDDGSIETLPGGGTVLGILPDLGYEQQTCRLETGDLLVIYSDGVTEAVKPGTEDEFGEQRLADMMAQHRDRPAEELIRMVTDAVAEWTAGAPPADDITLVIARRTA